MSLEEYRRLLFLQGCRWSEGTFRVQSLRLTVEPEASIWHSLIVRSLGI